MPKKKQTKKKETTTTKSVTLFDHINQLTQFKKKNFWENLTVSEKKTFNVYIINRFLSMDMDYIDFINLIQQYTIGILTPKQTYDVYMDFIPKNKVYLKYMKSRKEFPYDKEILDYVVRYFEVSKKEAEQYVNIFLKKYGGKKELIDIICSYGIEEKKALKMLTNKK